MSNQIVCIASYKRSGSSLLQQVINSNTNYNIIDELPGVMPDLLSFLFKTKSVDSCLTYNKNNKISTNHSIFTNNSFNYADLINDISQVFKNNFFDESKQIVGWKENDITPETLSYEKTIRCYNQIIELFPNIKFIFNIRNIFDTSRSAMWRNKSNSINIIENNNKFFEEIHLMENFYDKSILLNYDIWKSDKEYLIDNLSKLNINLDKEVVSKIMNTKFNHLKIW